MKIALSCESSADLSKEMIKTLKINVVPFSIILGDDIFTDEEGISEKIFEFVERTKIMPKTSAVNQEQFREHFTNILKDHDAIVHLSMSSKMSSAGENAKQVAKEIGEDKVKVIDTLSLSSGIALLLLYARKLLDAGEQNPEVIVEKIKQRMPHVKVSFVANRVDYLYKGGRCGMLAFYGANLLKIKPEITVENGVTVNSKKFLGLLSNTVEKYYANTLNKYKTPDLENVFITSTSISRETVEMLKKRLQERGFKNIFVAHASGTISSHCGPECVGVLLLNDGR